MSAKAEEFGDELQIDLKKPIDGPAGPVSKLLLREPTAGEIMQWDSLIGAEADVMAISVVAGLPKSVVEKLPARDFYLASRFIGHFLV